MLLNHQPPDSLAAKVGGAGIFAASTAAAAALRIILGVPEAGHAGPQDPSLKGADGDKIPKARGGVDADDEAERSTARFYLAPEVIAAARQALQQGGSMTLVATKEADVYSFGMLMVQASRCATRAR